MTTLKVKNYQLGQSATAAENFIVEADAAGVSVSTGTVGGGALTERFNINSNGSLELKNAVSQKVAAKPAATNVTFDCAAGNVFNYTLSNDTTFYATNVPTTGAYQLTVFISFPALPTFYSHSWQLGDDVFFPGGAESYMDGRVSRYSFLTDNGGATWYATTVIL